jgi:BRO family protein
MTKENAIRLFQDHRVRVHWNDENEKWYFSIIDVIGVLTESENPRKYWSVLKTRLKKEGSEVATNCSRLKLLAVDGKMRLTDIADTEQLLRLIQSIPSPKAEPFKVWLAKVGYERIEETEDPEIAFDRAMETYLKKGYSKNWINQRLKSIEVRKELIPNEYQNDRYKLFLFPFFFVKKYFRNKGYAKIFCLDKEKNNTISLSIIPKLNWYY